MGKEKETVAFWDHLEFFFLSDDDARWKAIGWIILVVGVCGSVDLALLDSPIDDSVVLMGFLALILSLGWIGWYCSFRRVRLSNTEPRSISRRTWVFQAGILIAFCLSLRLPRAEARAVERKLQQASDDPFDPESAKAAQQELAAARAGFLRIDSRILKDTGAKFIRTAEHNPDAWSAVQEYLTYRSFLNADFVPALTPSTGTSKYRSSVNITALQPNPEHHPAFSVFFAGGYARGDKSARLEQLSNPQPEGSEFAYFIIDGGNATIGLDGEYMKNVIIRNCDVSYAGGPVMLENVWFINCTFHAYGRLVPAAKELGNAILAHPPVTFSTSS
jgi:hypothetical protein